MSNVSGPLRGGGDRAPDGKTQGPRETREAFQQLLILASVYVGSKPTPGLVRAAGRRLTAAITELTDQTARAREQNPEAPR